MRALAAGAACFWLALGPLTAAAQEEESEGFRGSVGAGLVYRPRYPGSDDHAFRVLPVVALSYGRYFVGAEPGTPGVGGGLGARLFQSGGFRFGAVLSADFRSPRKESDDPRLQGMGDIDRTVRAGVFASYTAGWLTLRVSTASDIGGNGQGTLVRFDALGRYRASDKLTLSAGPGIGWASAERARTFFGVSAAQSAASGLPQYTPGSGIESARLSFSARYAVAPRWTAGAFVAAERLQGDAASSPITQSVAQNSAGLFASHRF